MRLAQSQFQPKYQSAPKAQDNQRFGANPLEQAGNFLKQNARTVNTTVLGTAGGAAGFFGPGVATAIGGAVSGAAAAVSGVWLIGTPLATALGFIASPFIAPVAAGAAVGTATAAAVNGGVNARYVATQGKNAFGLKFLVGLGAKAKVAAFNTYSGIRNTVSTALGAVAGNRLVHHTVVPQLESEVAKIGAYTAGTVGGGVAGNVVGKALISKETIINLTKGANKNGFFKGLAKAFHM